MATVRGEPALGLRERKKRRTRATLIDAAVGLCEQQGFDDTTVDQIAAIADVSPRTFSRYFATKDAIAIALIDEVIDQAAVELAGQPPEISHFEALRRAYIAMAERSRKATAGGLTSDRLLQILRIVVSSGALRQAVLEYRATPVDQVLAQRMGVAVEDRRVKMVTAVWAALLMTVLRDGVESVTADADLTIDRLVAMFEAAYAEFVDEFAVLQQPV